jgi:hypothetical protein
MQFVARDIDLMCKKGSKFTPQALAYGNTTRFSKYNLATPAYRLANLKSNENQLNNVGQIPFHTYYHD